MEAPAKLTYGGNINDDLGQIQNTAKAGDDEVALIPELWCLRIHIIEVILYILYIYLCVYDVQLSILLMGPFVI